MTTEIQRSFDPNLDIPEGLSNSTVADHLDNDFDLDGLPSDLNPQDTYDFDSSDVEGDDEGETLAAPSYIEIISQTVKVAPDGRHVVDVVIDVEEIVGATNYEVRITRA